MLEWKSYHVHTCNESVLSTSVNDTLASADDDDEILLTPTMDGRVSAFNQNKN